MPTAGLAAIAALFVLDASKNDIAGGGVAVEKIASCAGFGVEAVAEGFVIGLGVILGAGHGKGVSTTVFQNYGEIHWEARDNCIISAYSSRVNFCSISNQSRFSHRFCKITMPTANTETPKPHRRTAEHFRGCLLGGAAGDALGHPVEFMRIEKIHSIFGADGIRAYPEETGGLITDDTQMTLFTAEGLLRANTFLHGQEGLPDTDKRDIVQRYVHSAYKRWFLTQSPLAQSFQRRNTDPGLLSVPEMFARRAPGRTCMSALEDTPFGHKAANASKGCGGVMRVAPVGLLFPPEEAFRIGCETAAITHGHRTGKYSAGFLAMLISLLADGYSLTNALDETYWKACTFKGSEETASAVKSAINYASDDANPVDIVNYGLIGQGWIAEEALAIGIFSAIVADGDVEKGLSLAVNHSGDSDSTGSIAGQILGVMLGESAIPAKFLERLELSEVIRNTADDLFTGYSSEASWTERYTEELPQTAKVHIPQTQEHPLPTIIGAIAGDIIGSIYELNNIKTTDFDLFASNSYFTDDTVLTMAVADCLLNKKEFARTIWEYGRQYPGRGYGRSFKAWLENDSPELRDSYGNGSAMRVSAIGFACKTLHDVLEIAKQSARGKPWTSRRHQRRTSNGNGSVSGTQRKLQRRNQNVHHGIL